MKFYYKTNDNLEMQKQDILVELTSQLNSQNEFLKIITQCLFNLNTIIQNTNQPDALDKMSKILPDFKYNLDIIKNNISNLERLTGILNNLDFTIFSETEQLETIQNYNKLAIEFNNYIYTNTSNVNEFLLQYMKDIQYISYDLATPNLTATSTSTSTSNISDENNDNSIKPKNLQDNKVLLISEIQNKVFLPYLIKDLEKKLKRNNSYKSIEEIINAEYIISLDRYKNSVISRFKETYNLMKQKENASITDSLDLALELSFNNLLNPAIITACKNLDELDIYLDCLNSNELDKFKFFEVKYETSPKKKRK